MLPREFPKWRTVHSYFAKWSEQDEEGISLLERVLKTTLAWPTRQGRNVQPTLLIINQKV